MGCFFSKDEINAIQIYHIVPEGGIYHVRIWWKCGEITEFYNKHEVMYHKLSLLKNYAQSASVYDISVTDLNLSGPYQDNNIISHKWITIDEALMKFIR